MVLLGIFGAICSIGGYEKQKKEKSEFPEFYEKLKGLKIAVVPERVSFSKKIQFFNNSVGYASDEPGNNLIVKEQWLENPCWDIYILLDDFEYSKEIAKRITQGDFAYIPYLGKNDHFADITDASYVELESVSTAKKINSLFKKEIADSIFEDLDLDNENYETPYKYEEYLPVGLEQSANQYISDKFVFTNMQVCVNNFSDLYQNDEKTLFFF